MRRVLFQKARGRRWVRFRRHFYILTGSRWTEFGIRRGGRGWNRWYRTGVYY